MMRTCSSSIDASVGPGMARYSRYGYARCGVGDTTLSKQQAASRGGGWVVMEVEDTGSCQGACRA
jgi:hypothetical protein